MSQPLKYIVYCIIIIIACILKPTAYRSSYIFTLIQKVKHRVYKTHVVFLSEAILPRLCKLFHLNMTCTFGTDEVREKVPSFKKSQFSMI